MLLFEGRADHVERVQRAGQPFAHALKARGIGHGDIVSLMMENRIEFLAALVAIAKLGAVTSLINTNLRGRPLTHCVSVTQSKAWIFGEELSDAVAEVKADLTLRGRQRLSVRAPIAAKRARRTGRWISARKQPTRRRRICRKRSESSSATTRRSCSRPERPACRRPRWCRTGAFSRPACTTWRLGLKSRRERSAVHLPAAVSRHRTDGRILLDVVVRLFDVRAAQILGVELPEGGARVRHDLLRLHRRAVPLSREPARAARTTPTIPCRRIVGNGLRPDIWLDFKKRFGIKRITEFYGASEGNVAFMNLLNKDRTIGMTASTIALVRYDVDADEIIRDCDRSLRAGGRGRSRACCSPRSTKRRCSRATRTRKRPEEDRSRRTRRTATRGSTPAI